MGGPENGNFPLLYIVKMPFIGGWVVQKSLKTPLRNIKMAPKLMWPLFADFLLVYGNDGGASSQKRSQQLYAALNTYPSKMGKNATICISCAK